MASPVETLPEDVLLEIFNFLDAKSLKNAALVCKSWNDVISLSPKLLNKFTLKLYYMVWVDKIDEILSIRRKFQSITVFLNARNAIPLFHKISSRFGAKIRRLILNEGEFDNPNDFYNILRNMPLLQELEVNGVAFKCEPDHELRIDEPLNLKYLTKLTVNTSNWHIFGFVMTSPIKILRMFNKFRVVNNSQMMRYLEFLDTNVTLESMEFDMPVYSRTFFKEFRQKFNFKLKRFKCLLWTPYADSDEISVNFAKFLESQSSCLRELELNYEREMVIATIFTKLTVLEKLRLNASCLPHRNEYYNQFKQINNFKEFICHDAITSEISVKSILAKSPNLETLDARHDLRSYIPNLLSFISLHNSKIKNLSIDSLQVPVPPEIRLRHLKFFHVETFINFDFLLAFLGTNANIEKLSLNLTAECLPSDETLTALLGLPTVNHLIITAGEELLQNIGTKIQSFNHNLKRVELLKSSS